MASQKTTYNCAKCLRAISSNSYCIGCYTCKGWFHKGECSGLSLDAMKLVLNEQTSTGYKWHCQSCSRTIPPKNITASPSTNILCNNSVVIDHTSSTVPHVKNKNGNADVDLLNEISFLKQIIVEKDAKYELLRENKVLLEEKIMHLNQTITVLRQNKALLDFQQPETTPSTDEPLSQPLVAEVLKSSSSIKSIKLVNDSGSSNVKESLIIGTGTEFTGLSASKTLKWIFVSRLNKSVTDDQVKNHVDGTLGIEDAICVKITSSHLDDSSTNYASYKIGVPDLYFNTTMSSSSWPEGILIKEFRKRHQNKFQNRNRKTNYFHNARSDHRKP